MKWQWLIALCLYLAVAVVIYRALDSGLKEDSPSAKKINEAYATGGVSIRLFIDLVLIILSLFWPIMIIVPKKEENHE